MGWKIKDKNIRLKEMWAIINKKNNFNVIHTHPNCYLSAAYYVKAPKNCGSFFIENPNIKWVLKRVIIKTVEIINTIHFTKS